LVASIPVQYSTALDGADRTTAYHLRCTKHDNVWKHINILMSKQVCTPFRFFPFFHFFLK
jgi:hypothetical protein